MKKYLLLFLLFNMSKNIFTMDDLGMFGFRLNASMAVSSILGLFLTDFCIKNHLVEPKNSLIPFALVFATTHGYLTNRMIKQGRINSEKFLIERQVQTIDTMPDNNEAVRYINTNHFLSAFPNSEEEEKIVNPLCGLAHSYILGKKNNTIKIMVVPNANKTQTEEEIKADNQNALLQLLDERRDKINEILQRDTSFFNFLKPIKNQDAFIFAQRNDNGLKSIQP